MSNVFSQFGSVVHAIVEESFPDVPRELRERITVESPRDASHGDLATNAAMVLARQLRRKPAEIAQQIAEALGSDANVADVEIAGPGFINIRLGAGFWTRHLGVVLSEGTEYGAGALPTEKVNVEYVSANPTGPLHVGHCRGAVVGDALANLLEFAGQDVTREYYINDAGGQVDVLAASVLHRVREEAGELPGPMPEGHYPGEYLLPVARDLLARQGTALLTDPNRLAIVRDAAIAAMMELIRHDLALLGIRHDVFFSEATLHAPRGNANRIEDVIAELSARDLVYRGTLPPPKGAPPEDYEDREQLLLRSTQVGDDIDRPLVKSDGSFTYFAADVAYFADKFERGFAEMVFILGADHAGYVKRLQAVARAIAGDGAKLTVRLCQLVRLFRDGEPIRMGKRTGNFVTLRDVVEEVGRDAVRFMMLYRKNDAPLDFDFNKVTEQSKDNPVFYVQYAHARCMSVFRQAAREMPDLDTADDALRAADLGLLREEGEVAIIRKLAEWPKVTEAAARAHEPHRVAFYLYELAALFHAHWALGRERPDTRFVNPDAPRVTQARLALTRAVANIVATGLRIVGVSAPQEMR